MTKQVQRRRGTATQHTSFTGAEGELSVNTTNKSVHVHDNVTAGGFEAARADMDNVTSSSILTAAGITATTAELNYVDGVTSAIQTQLDGKAGTASPTFTGTLTTANLTATGTTTLAGASTSADITFGDNDKAIFGAGSDLQIYHDGAGSYISDQGVGPLNLLSGGVRLKDTTDTTTMLAANAGGSVTLYHNNSPKLVTTSTGIDVTGTVTADGLTVNGNATIQQDDALIFIKETDGTNIAAVGDLTGAGQGGAFYYDHGGTATIQLKSYEASTIENGLNVKGDISFYEDTGTTPKLFWDASAESLGIGTSSPSNLLDIQSSTASGGMLELNNTGDTSRMLFISNSDGMIIRSNNSASGAVAKDTIFQQGTVEAMRIDSSGNVGIGVVPETWNSANNGLQVGPRAAIFGTDSGYSGFSNNQYQATDGSAKYIVTAPASIINLDPDSTIKFRQAASGTAGTAITWSEAMRIDSSGNLIVGDTSAGGITSGGKFYATPSSGIYAAANADNAGYFNRNGGDGSIVEFRAGNAPVGSIGTAGSDLVMGTGASAIRFRDSTPELQPWNVTTNALVDGTMDIGGSNRRFKDLYLSGGVYLGGTGAANKLDDYEEGTWTPTGNGITYSSAFGSYVKVGRLVMITFNVTFPSTSDTNSARIESLPFTVTTGNAYQSGAYVTASDAGTIIDDTYFTISTSRLLIRNNGNGDRDNNQYSAKFIQGSAVYMTD